MYRERRKLFKYECLYSIWNFVILLLVLWSQFSTYLCVLCLSSIFTWYQVSNRWWWYDNFVDIYAEFDFLKRVLGTCPSLIALFSFNKTYTRLLSKYILRISCIMTRETLKLQNPTRLIQHTTKLSLTLFHFARNVRMDTAPIHG